MEKSNLLIVSGVNFLRAYAGTIYLIQALESMDNRVRVLVTATEKEAEEYARLNLNIHCLIRRKPQGVARKVETIIHHFTILHAMLRSPKVIITENGYLYEAAIAKWLRRTQLVLGQYCQELHLPCDYPNIPRIKLLAQLARVPDFVVDVEPNRARIRMEKLRLQKMPYVLRNTLPISGIPTRVAAGGLETLAGLALPTDFPVLIHMGGIGREKPLERVIDAVATCRFKVFFLAFCNGPDASIGALRHYAQSKLEPGTFAILGSRRRDELLASAWEADIGVIDYSPSVENTHNQRYCAPTKLYEFMALGLAILGSDNDSLRQIIDCDRIGICAQGGHSTDLGIALESIVANIDEMRAMGNRAEKAFRLFHCYEKRCLPVVEQISTLFDRSSQPIR